MKRSYQHVCLSELTRADNQKPFWRVTWRPERAKVKIRTFSNRDKAEAEANHIERLFAHGLRSVAEIPVQQLSEINLMLLQIPDVPVHEVIQFYLQNRAAHLITVEHAGKQFIESRSNMDEYSERWITDVRLHMTRFIASFGSRYVNTIRTAELASYLSTVGINPRTRLSHAITLSAFGNWMRTEKRWLPATTIPTAFHVKHPKCRTTDKTIHTPEEMTRLLVFTPLNLLPFLTVGAFGGMRSAERMRLKKDHWQPDNAQFALPSSITKTQRRRIVDVQPNFEAWINLAGHVTPVQNPYTQTSKVAKSAGVPWKHNALRSSFASYHLMKFKNEALTAMLCGHSVQTLNTSYKGLTGVTDQSANEWFSITPQTVILYASEKGLPQPLWVKDFSDAKIRVDLSDTLWK